MKGIIDSDVLSFDAKSRSYPGDIVRVISPDTKRVIMYHVNPRFVAHHGIASIRNKQMELAEELRDGPAQIEDVHIYCAEDLSNHVALFTANVQGMDPEDVGVILDADVGIAVLVGLHCAPLVHESLRTSPRGSVRFSVGPFNTNEDIDTALAAMGQIAGASKSCSPRT